MRGFLMGAAAGVAVSLAVTAWAGRMITTVHAGGATEGKASYRILLENDRVRVREAVFPPGVTSTGTHTHEYAHVGVILTKGTLLFTDPAGKTESVHFDAGSVGFREAKATHDVGNPGPDAMRVIEVELK